jgi:hypothetical protein
MYCTKVFYVLPERIFSFWKIQMDNSYSYIILFVLWKEKMSTFFSYSIHLLGKYLLQKSVARSVAAHSTEELSGPVRFVLCTRNVLKSWTKKEIFKGMVARDVSSRMIY